jgi:manganese transport protein
MLARRAVAVIPASIAVALGMGEVTALVLSQVVLGLLLPGIAFVLVWVTSDPRVMGTLANGRGTRRIGYLLCALLAVASMLALVPAGVLCWPQSDAQPLAGPTLDHLVRDGESPEFTRRHI